MARQRGGHLHGWRWAAEVWVKAEEEGGRWLGYGLDEEEARWGGSRQFLRASSSGRQWPWRTVASAEEMQQLRAWGGRRAMAAAARAMERRQHPGRPASLMVAMVEGSRWASLADRDHGKEEMADGFSERWKGWRRHLLRAAVLRGRRRRHRGEAATLGGDDGYSEKHSDRRHRAVASGGRLAVIGGQLRRWSLTARGERRRRAGGTGMGGEEMSAGPQHRGCGPDSLVHHGLVLQKACAPKSVHSKIRAAPKSMRSEMCVAPKSVPLQKVC